MSKETAIKSDPPEDSVIITLPTTPPTTLKLDTKAVDEVLFKLGAARQQLSPAVRLDYDVTQGTVQGILNPGWYTYVEPMQGNSVIAFRDPRFGWLHYVLPKEGAVNLATALTAQANQPGVEAPKKLN